MEVPNAKSHTDVLKRGYLQKLSSRSFPYIPHPWKRKYCVLVKGQLFYYERDDSKGADKGSGVINLEYYDQVVEAGAKEAKKASHAFVITSQDKTFFDPGRHIFSADTAAHMNEWIKILKKSIDQIRNNNKTTAVVVADAAAAATLSPSSGAASNRQSASAKPTPKITLITNEKKNKDDAEIRGKNVISISDENKTAENKENLQDWAASSERKSKVADSSLRRRKPAAGSRAADEEFFETTDSARNFYSLGRKKPEADQTPSGSLGRKQNTKSEKSASDNPEKPVNNMGKSKEIGKKRKADDEGAEDAADMEVVTAGQLESVTKHRVKGPAGRRMPQHRRTLLMKHRASSLSALALPPDASGRDDPSNSFVPWLNRSLDLLGDDDLAHPSRNSQPAMGYRYSEPEDYDEMALMYDPQSVAFGNNISFDDNSMGIYIDDGFSNQNLSTGGIPPPLPPRMESRMEFVPGTTQNPFQMHQRNQLQQHLQQMHYQTSLMQNQNQISSPFGTTQEEKTMNRKSQPDMELFVSSYSEDNSCEGPQPHAEAGPMSRRLPQQPGSKSVPNQQRQRKGLSQPDMARFTEAVRNLQKHVVELDQAVNEITKEVEDSKSDLSIVKMSLVSVKKDKEKLHDAISIVSQEAAKMKEQVSSSLKEAERLQKTATAALLIAEKAKTDQQNLKKEYENLLRHMKSTITALKKEALKASISAPSTLIYQKLHGDSSDRDDEEEGCDNDNESVEEENDGDDDKKRKSKENTGKKQGFFSRPSSIISGLTGRSSLTKSTPSLDTPEKDKNKDSPNKNREKRDKDKSLKAETKLIEKNAKKDNFKTTKGPLERGQKLTRHMSDDFPMIDGTTSPLTISPAPSKKDLSSMMGPQDHNLAEPISSPAVASRPRKLNLKPQKSGNSGASSPDSPTRTTSPFDVPKMTLNGRAASPTGFAIHRPGSTPGSLSRQGSMTTVPEDRAIDTRAYDSRPSDPPPPPPTNRVFAISRQSSSPNIATQKSNTSTLTKQRSLGVLLEEAKSPISRQSSTISMIDDRPIVDQTLPMSPASSLMSFQGSWSTTSLNRPDSAIGFNESDEFPRSVTSPKLRPRGPLEQVAGTVLAGSNLQASAVHPLDESGIEPPLATSSLKKRKKVKTDPVFGVNQV